MRQATCHQSTQITCTITDITGLWKRWMDSFFIFNVFQIVESQCCAAEKEITNSDKAMILQRDRQSEKSKDILSHLQLLCDKSPYKMHTYFMCWISCPDQNAIEKTNGAFILACHMPLCPANAACSFIVSTKRFCRSSSSQRGVAFELNWSQLCVIYRCGQSSKVIDLLARCYFNAWSSLSGKWSLCSTNDHHRSGKVASGKLVWKQHKVCDDVTFNSR